jgi:hypothetical protein
MQFGVESVDFHLARRAGVSVVAAADRAVRPAVDTEFRAQAVGLKIV